MDEKAIVSGDESQHPQRCVSEKSSTSEASVPLREEKENGKGEDTTLTQDAVLERGEASGEVSPAPTSPTPGGDTSLPQPEVTPTTIASPSPPPNGGVRAWLQVLGSFCLYFNTWGVVSSYGTFQAIFEDTTLRHQSPFQISVIGSLQTFLMVSLGILVGPAFDAGYFRHLLVLGTFLVVAGTLLQSFSVYFWQYLLTQGVLVGVGAGCLSLLGVIVPSLWFTTRLPIANGIAASGSGLGGVVLPIMLRELNARVGLPWATRAISFLSLFLLLVALLVLRLPGSSGGGGRRTPRSLVDPTVFKDWPFLLFVLGCSVVFLGLYTPFVHIQTYAAREGIASPSFALYILAILNSSSILGRILPSLVAQHMGSMNMIIGTCATLSIASFCLITTGVSLARLLAAVVAYGFFTGSFFALQPTIFVRLTSDPRMIGTRFGMAFLTMSVALLFGPPISGALLDEAGYDAAWVWAGATIMAGGGLILASRVKKAGLALKQAI